MNKAQHYRSNEENDQISSKFTPNRFKLSENYTKNQVSSVSLEGRMSRLRKSEKYIVKLTNAEAFTSTFKALVGIGILTCPSAYKEVGIYGGISGSILITLIVSVMYNQMVSVIEQTSSATHRTLGEISEKIFSHKIKFLVELCILGCQLSVCISYLRYFGEQMSDLACQRTDGGFCGHRIFFAFIGVIFLTLMALLKNFKQLSLISYIANCTVVLAFVAVCVDSAYVIGFRSTPQDIKYFELSNYPQFLSLISLSMEGTAILPGIYASTFDKKSYRNILGSAVFVDGFFTMILSCVAYIAYGNNTREIVIMNMSYGLISNVIQIGYAFGVLCSFALQLFPILEVVENKRFYADLVKNVKFSDSQSEQDKIFVINMICRVIIILFVFTVSQSIKNINFILQLSGSVFSNALMFIIPPCLYLKLFNGQVSIVRLGFNVIIIMLGVANALRGLYNCFQF
eukprot:403354253